MTSTTCHPRKLFLLPAIFRLRRPSKHFQLLLYLTLHSAANQDQISHSPLSILYNFLSVHPPPTFAHCLPTIPTSGKAKDDPRWLKWEANSRVEEDAHKLMSGCQEDGIWTLLWVKDGVTKKSQRDDEDENEEDVKVRVVSERGWEILEWLVAVWEEDEVDHQKQHPGRGELKIRL